MRASGALGWSTSSSNVLSDWTMSGPSAMRSHFLGLDAERECTTARRNGRRLYSDGTVQRAHAC